MDVGDQVTVLLGQLEFFQLRDLVILRAADMDRAFRVGRADLLQGNQQVGVPFRGRVLAVGFVVQLELQRIGIAGETGGQLFPDGGEAGALADRILVETADRLRADRDAVLDRVFRFLDVDPAAMPAVSKARL